jgi:leader peptidase (prepilin peptidase) / N-methyltransferase
MSLPVVILAAAFGAAAGAFVPRPAYRLAVPWGTAVRSACADCNEPFATWVRAGPACRCRRGGWWPAVTGSGAAAALVAAALGPVPELPVLLLAVVLGALLAAVDVRCLRLPDPLVAALGLLVLPLGLGHVRAALAGAALLGGTYLLLSLASRGAVGLGDAKLAAVLGFALGALGWPAVLAGLVAPHLINGPIAVFLLLTKRVRRTTALPLGPALLAGAVVAVSITGA